MSTTKGTIKVHNLAQQILLVCELQGQMSDGFWEDSSPHDHWEKPACADVVVDPENVGMDFYPLLSYNFADKELLDVVGDRMIGFVKAKIAFPHLDMENHWDWDMSDFSPTAPISGEYWEKKNARQIEMFGMQLIDAVEKINAVEYTRTQLIKDLEALGKIFSNAQK